jgi:CRP-like cAMP-binding protein
MPHHGLNWLVRRLETSPRFPKTRNKQSSICQPGWRTCGPMLISCVREIDRHKAVCSVEGFLTRYKSVSDGKRQIMAFYVPGDIPDLLSLHIHVMDHSLATIIPSKVAFIPHDALGSLIDQNPRIARAFWRETLIDASIFREWIVNLGSRDAYSRIAHLICEVFLKLNAVGLTNGNSCAFPITQGEIGDATGLSTVHVNRSIMELRKDDLIVLEKGRCTIRDLSRLEEAAMFDPTYLHLTGEGKGGNERLAGIAASVGAW